MRLALSVLLFAALPSIAHAAQPVDGRWVTDDGKALVRISRCGNAVCGNVVRILAKTPTKNPTDIHNPDPKLRSRPVQGLTILSGFHEDGDKWRGQIYDPEHGKTYRSTMQRASADTIKVKGCVAIFCKTQTWKRAN